MYLCFFFCKKINVEAREFSLIPTFIIEPNFNLKFDIEENVFLFLAMSQQTVDKYPFL